MYVYGLTDEVIGIKLVVDICFGILYYSFHELVLIFKDLELFLFEL